MTTSFVLHYKFSSVDLNTPRQQSSPPLMFISNGANGGGGRGEGRGEGRREGTSGGRGASGSGYNSNAGCCGGCYGECEVPVVKFCIRCRVVIMKERTAVGCDRCTAMIHLHCGQELWTAASGHSQVEVMGVSRLVWVCPDCRDPTPTPALEPPRPAQGIAAVDIRELLARSVAAADQSQARMMCDPSQGASDELLKIMMSASKRDQA